MVVCGQHVGRGLAELLDLIGEDVEGELAVQQGVVAGLPDQAGVLVVLDQVVVGAARVGQGVEPQGIDDGEPEQIQVGIDGPQVGDVEMSQDVVAHYEGGALAQPVDAPDAGGVPGVVALEVEFIAGVGPVGGHGDEAAVLVLFPGPSERQFRSAGGVGGGAPALKTGVGWSIAGVPPESAWPAVCHKPPDLFRVSLN